ncbi:uncharacterized protein LODBEIA_P12590 [Lodderomyces beijingensis]|uniref:N-acetyltransferase domain-containing protein n=1 Tax=Lodderomyces beijingensis TaxID=1775926 RepID=A0ABP0ZL80_9ASCO
MSDFPPNLSIRPLTIEDVQQSAELETKGFPPEERCSTTKLKYRLTVCPELCSGLFIRDFEYKYNSLNLPEVARQLEREHHQQDDNGDLKMDDGKSNGNDNDKNDGGNNGGVDADNVQDDADDDEEFPPKSSVTKEQLVGHIIGTKIAGSRITEECMEMPSTKVKGSGHVETSRVIGIHSVVIDPEWRGKNLAALLLHDYIQKLSNQDVGDQIVLIAHDALVPFYEKIGFNNLGESECKFAGTTWYDMAIDLIASDDL